MHKSDPVSSVPAASFFQPGYAHLPLNALNSFSLFDLFEDALADIFCLKTFVHGTSPRNYYNIIWTGADPGKAAREETGVTAMRRFTGDTPEERRRLFHLTSDCDEAADECPQIATDVCNGLMKKVAPRLYATGATIGEQNYPKKIGANESWDWSDYATLVKGFVLSIFSPTLKFRFNPDLDTPNFTAASSDSVYVRESIGTEHIGLYGTLVQGLQGDLIARIQKEPSTCILGVVKLVAAVALTIIVAYGVAYSTALIFTIARGVLMYEAAVCVGRVVVPLLFAWQGEIQVEGKEKSKLSDGFTADNTVSTCTLANMRTFPSAPSEVQFANLPPAFRPDSESQKSSRATTPTQVDSPLAHPSIATLRQDFRSVANDVKDDGEFEADVAEHAQPYVASSFTTSTSDDGIDPLLKKKGPVVDYTEAEQQERLREQSIQVAEVLFSGLGDNTEQAEFAQRPSDREYQKFADGFSKE